MLDILSNVYMAGFIHSYFWIARAECFMFYFSPWPIFWGSVSPHSLFYDEVIACSSLVNHDSRVLINSVAGSLSQCKRDLELFHTCYVGVHHCSWHWMSGWAPDSLSSVELCAEWERYTQITSAEFSYANHWQKVRQGWKTIEYKSAYWVNV